MSVGPTGASQREGSCAPLISHQNQECSQRRPRADEEVAPPHLRGGPQRIVIGTLYRSVAGKAGPLQQTSILRNTSRSRLSAAAARHRGASSRACVARGARLQGKARKEKTGRTLPPAANPNSKHCHSKLCHKGKARPAAPRRMPAAWRTGETSLRCAFCRALRMRLRAH